MVRDLALAVGHRLGLERNAMEDLSIVALLHDVGKIGIPDEVLHKPGPLSEADWALMRQHPLIGERILSSVAGLDRTALAVRHAHENWDGSGYPRGLAGEDIPISGRITMLADVYDALGSHRCYKEPWTPDAIHAYLVEQSGKKFDPKIGRAHV